MILGSQYSVKILTTWGGLQGDKFIVAISLLQST